MKTAEDWLRPSVAAKRFSVCQKTLANWARRGLIRRSQVEGVVWYSGADLDALRAVNASERQVVPIASAEPAEAAAPNWRNSEFWKGAAR